MYLPWKIVQSERREGKRMNHDPYFVRLENPLIDAFLQLGHCLFGVYYWADFWFKGVKTLGTKFLMFKNYQSLENAKKYPSQRVTETELTVLVFTGKKKLWMKIDLRPCALAKSQFWRLVFNGAGTLSTKWYRVSIQTSISSDRYHFVWQPQAYITFKK